MIRSRLGAIARFARFAALFAAVCLVSGTLPAQSCDEISYYDFTTLAGPPLGVGHADAVGLDARFYEPTAIATAPSGEEFYVADSRNHVIRKVSLNGTVTTIAGIPGSPGSNDGPALEARFNEPRGIAANTVGDIFVADYGNHTIRRIDANGIVTTVAGLAGAPGEVDDIGTNARFAGPWGIIADDEGNIVVTDAIGHTIRLILSTGDVITVGGAAGSPGHTDGPPGVSRFHTPLGLTPDADGNVWVADSGNHVIRVLLGDDGTSLTPAGVIGEPGTQDGFGPLARFNRPTNLLFVGDALLIVDAGNYAFRSLVFDGENPIVATAAGVKGQRGYEDGLLGSARFDNPSGLALDGVGGVVMTELSAGTLRRAGPTGVLLTLAGTPRPTGSVSGVGEDARFNEPWGSAIDSSGNLFVADRLNHTIRKVAPDGAVTTIAGQAGIAGQLDGPPGIGLFHQPSDIAIDGQGNLFIADSGNHAIRRLDAQGNLTTYAGILGTAGSANGPRAQSTFRNPESVAFDAQGNLYVADSGNSTVRRIGSTDVMLIAGSAGQAGTTNGPSLTARFRRPSGIGVAPDGSIWVADSAAHTIRRIAPGGGVTTEAGLADTPGTAGGPGTSVRFHAPSGLTIDGSGNVFVADRDNMAIRRIGTDGHVTTAGGSVGAGGTEAGLGPLSRLSQPASVAFDASGRMHVVSSGNGVVHRGSAVAPLCLENDRFALSLSAIDPRTSDRGLGLAIPQNDVFGYFAIPGLTQNPGNPEVFTKVLDGSTFNGNFWVFFGGLTDFEFDLVVTDTVGGETKVYHKEGGSFCGGADTSAFAGSGKKAIASRLASFDVTEINLPALDVSPNATCGVDALCLFNDRFTLSLAAKDPRTQATGAGLSIPQSDLFGYFAIPDLTQNPDNPEVFVKVLDGREVNGKFWVFHGGLTDFEYTLTVTDTQTQAVRQYTKEGLTFCGGADTDAF